MNNQLLLPIIITAIFILWFGMIHRCAAHNTIHNNKVHFSGKLAHVSFILDKYCVTNGQKLSKVIPAGNLNIIVRASRSASGEVADCFNDWVSFTQNTFHHHAKKLNFVIKGTLVFYTQSDGNKSYRFNDVVLAQGRSVLSNNWWFGGVHCRYAKKSLPHSSKLPHNVSCRSLEGVQWCFHRATGAGVVNSVDVYQEACK
ncbi:MAG: hypothetical protein OXD32_04355 [Endozoicomonadaceae bacterium]|nr:hypothetical protein [Endozoicomonadaceae bacterium]MCY4329016.1 hypothetical protein [Endozoicomonadaceae bacterium]